MDSQKDGFPITDKTTWILGAGASYDCIGPNRTCVPITRSLLIPHNIDNTLLDNLCQLFGKDDVRDKQEIDKMLGPEMELTFDWIRKECNEGQKKNLAEKVLKGLTDAVAERIRDAQVESTLAHGGSVGFIYCAENYLWLASRTCHFEGWSVITLNYDTVLDRAYEELGARGFPVPPYQNWINLVNNHLSHKKDKFMDWNVYVKLHGSLDIYYCLNSNCRNYRRPFSIRLEPEELQTRDGLIEAISPPENPECETCGDVTSEFILPPGENKIDAEWSFHNLAYTQARIALANTFSWIFVGYSCPEYDKDIINLLKTQLHDARSKKLQKFIGVISPDAEVVANRMSCLLDYPVRPINEAFSHFIDNIMAIEGSERPGLA